MTSDMYAMNREHVVSVYSTLPFPVTVNTEYSTDHQNRCRNLVRLIIGCDVESDI